MTAWIGIDPGARFSGLVLRSGNDCVDWVTVVRTDDETEIGPGPAYWHAIDRAVLNLAGIAIREGLTAPLISIEGVRAPGGFRDGKKQFAKPADIMALGATFGAVLTQNPDAIVVPPGGNGRGVYGQYPDELVSAGEKRGRNWRLKDCGKSSPQSHARSAWAVAGKAAQMAGGQ